MSLAPGGRSAVLGIPPALSAAAVHPIASLVGGHQAAAPAIPWHAMPQPVSQATLGGAANLGVIRSTPNIGTSNVSNLGAIRSTVAVGSTPVLKANPIVRRA